MVECNAVCVDCSAEIVLWSGDEVLGKDDDGRVHSQQVRNVNNFVSNGGAHGSGAVGGMSELVVDVHDVFSDFMERFKSVLFVIFDRIRSVIHSATPMRHCIASLSCCLQLVNVFLHSTRYCLPTHANPDNDHVQQRSCD